MNIIEEYKEFHPNYEISNYGNVRRKIGNDIYNYHILSATPNRYKHVIIPLSPDWKSKKTILIHRLVAEYFIGPRPEGMVVDHIDRDKHNNHVSNLRYTDFKGNNRNNPNFKDHVHETITLKNGEERLVTRIRNNGHYYKRYFKTEQEVKKFIEDVDAGRATPTYTPSKGGEGHLHTYTTVKGETKYRAMRRIQGSLFTKVFDSEDSARAWIVEATIESKPERSGRRHGGNITRRTLKNGDVRYDAKIKIDKCQKAKTFLTQEEAEAWLCEIQK